MQRETEIYAQRCDSGKCECDQAVYTPPTMYN